MRLTEVGWVIKVIDGVILDPAGRCSTAAITDEITRDGLSVIYARPEGVNGGDVESLLLGKRK